MEFTISFFTCQLAFPTVRQQGGQEERHMVLQLSSWTQAQRFFQQSQIFLKTWLLSWEVLCVQTLRSTQSCLGRLISLPRLVRAQAMKQQVEGNLLGALLPAAPWVGGAGRTSPSSVVLYVEDAFLSEHIRTISHPFQTGRVFFPLVPNDIDTESNYMSDHPLYSCCPFLLTLKNVCLFLQTKKKGVHIFLLRYSPPSASPLFFQKDKSFWQRNRWTSTKALVFIFSFLSNLNCCCLQSLLWIE